MPNNNGAMENEQDEYYPPYPAVQPPAVAKYDSYDKLQSGAPGKAAK